jgi:hypothetical protein
MRFPSFSTAICLLLLAGPGRAQTAPDTLRPPQTADLALLAFQKTSACANPFGLHEGQNTEYQLLDAKGKVTGIWRYRVVKISTDSTAPKKKQKSVVTTSVRLKSGLYDPTNHVLQQQDLKYFCRHDTTFTDGLGEINYDGLKSFRDRLLAYTGSPIAWPNQPTAGSSLGNGGVSVQVSSPSVAIAKVNTTLLKRKVLPGRTTVKVPAGTFSCYSVESQRELATAARADLVLKNTARQVDYYDPAVGLVKTEYYDKGNKLVQTRVLSKR